MKKTLMTVLAIILTATLGLAGCASADTPQASGSAAGASSAASAAPAPQEGAADGYDGEVLFGAILPLTGVAAEGGLSCSYGLNLAVNNINAAGGLDIGGQKMKVVLKIEDDQNNAAESLSAAERLLNQDKVSFLFCPPTSANSLAVMEIAADYPDVLFSTISCTSNNFKILIGEDPERYFNFYKPEYNSDDYAVSDLSSLAAAVEKGFVSFDNNVMAILAEDSDYGRSYEQNFRLLFEEYFPGGTLLDCEFYEPSAVDFYASINKLTASSPDIVVFIANAISAQVAFTRQAAEMDATWHDHGVAAAVYPNFAMEAGEYAENLTLCFWDDMYHDPDILAFEDTLAAAFPEAIISPGVIVAYDTAMIAFDNIAKAATLSAQGGLADAYAATDYQGLHGRYVFKPDHTVMVGPEYINFKLGQYQDGVIEVLWPDADATTTFRPQN